MVANLLNRKERYVFKLFLFIFLPNLELLTQNSLKQLPII